MTENSRKGAQAFATGNFNKGLNGVLGTINAGAQKVGKKLKKDKSRKGTGPLCDLGSVSGKGSRPENLNEIATKITLGRNRSIGTPTATVEEPTTEAPEDQTREGGILRSIGKVVTNGAKVIGNGIHAAADELVAGGKDALNDKSTDFENVSSKIRNTPGGTSDEAAEKAKTPAGAQAGTQANAQSAGTQDVASRVINGEFGNGQARTKALTDAGYDPQEVQSQVNSRLKSGKRGSRKGSHKGSGFGYHKVVLHEISPKQITSIPGGGVVNHEGQSYKIEGLPEFEPNEWIHKLVIWTDNDPDWDYSYDYCDWE